MISRVISRRAVVGGGPGPPPAFCSRRSTWSQNTHRDARTDQIPSRRERSLSSKIDQQSAVERLELKSATARAGQRTYSSGSERWGELGALTRTIS